MDGGALGTTASNATLYQPTSGGMIFERGIRSAPRKTCPIAILPTIIPHVDYLILNASLRW